MSQQWQLAYVYVRPDGVWPLYIILYLRNMLSSHRRKQPKKGASFDQVNVYLSKT